MIQNHRTILLVEDDLGDIDLVREAMKQAEAVINLQVVEDGVEALAYLRQEGNYAKSPRPDLIVLDLNLPKKDGREVLYEVKNDPRLKSIPIIALSTSALESDISTSYRLGANCYISKPLGLSQFVRVIKSIQQFWFEIAKLPPHGTK